mmetsp:Transcript_95302/g.308705  ORF Transcript_95302/g.308705 Transcript_95302/m.308705 type:complete len:91 (-) Transcript_95302:426-698(-)
MSGFLRAPGSLEEEIEELVAVLAASLHLAAVEQSSRAATAAAVPSVHAAAPFELEPEVGGAASALSPPAPDNVARCGDIWTTAAPCCAAA